MFIRIKPMFETDKTYVYTTIIYWKQKRKNASNIKYYKYKIKKKIHENCPWFSLRSNSIESRFRSIRWGNFWFIFSWIWEKAKARSKAARNSLRSWAFFLATLDLGIKLGKFAPMRDALWCRWLMDRELVIRERKGQIFSVRS